MIELNVDIATRDGAMNCFITHPESNGPHPVVLFLMDAPGKREELHDMASRLATAGYYVVLPNLYYRSVREFNVFSGEPDQGRDAMVALMSSLTDELVASDAAAIFEYIDVDPQAKSARVGVVGYCMSGPFAFALACLYPERVVAAASIHGVRLFGDGSPAHLANQSTAELYFACAEFDQWAPADVVNSLADYLTALHLPARVEWYPGVHHGFTFSKRGPDIYDQPSAERHWERLHDLFRRNLLAR